VLLVVAAVVLLADAWPDLTGAGGEHIQGDATLWLVIVILPVTIAGLLSVVIARQLWLDRPGAATELIAWIVVALMVSGGFATAEGNALSSLRRILFEGGVASFDGAALNVVTRDGVGYFGYLDDPTFWLPALLLLAAIALAALLAAWIAFGRPARPSTGLTKGAT
jgi:hypothetical protein